MIAISFPVDLRCKMAILLSLRNEGRVLMADRKMVSRPTTTNDALAYVLLRYICNAGVSGKLQFVVCEAVDFLDGLIDPRPRSVGFCAKIIPTCPHPRQIYIFSNDCLSMGENPVGYA